MRPARVYRGGDSTGDVHGIVWSSWGGARAVGRGTSVYPTGDQSVAETRPSRVTVVAYDLGTCGGRRAYLRIQWYDPAKGGRFETRNGLPTCEPG